MLSDPIIFEPLFMERVWGGRRLESLYKKHLPMGTLIGESWEIVDRPEAQSVVHSGPLRGKTLHELWTGSRSLVFGDRAGSASRFPLLIKILDAQDRLSIQVHPPASIAPILGGEPKTEMWYIADTYASEADLYVGLKQGVSREEFESAIRVGTVEQKVHRVTVRKGDHIFIPSGRLHAIGSGNVIFEIQQNSDTTYRVFDWNREDANGVPRKLHVEESLQSIDFQDFEPGLSKPEGESLVNDTLFRVERWALNAARDTLGENDFAIFAVVSGKVACGNEVFEPGTFFLVPNAIRGAEIRPQDGGATVLRVTIPV